MRRNPMRSGTSAVILFVVLAAAIIAGSAFVTGAAQQDVVWPASFVPTQDSSSAVLPSETVYSDIYNHVSPSVVSINVVARTPSTQFFDEEFSGGTGTGFVLDQQGHIVTNAHVVDGAIRIEVNFRDGSIYRGEMVGIDYDSDLAVIQVQRVASELVPVPLGDSDALFIGQEVVAIGSPFNQPWTLTTGIVSALDRTIDGLGEYQIGEVIQTDAAINPGNSGGPLLNLNGEVIGVNSQIISQSRSSSGVGFAIPSNLVRRVASELIADGAVDYSYLGIRGGDIDLATIETLGLPNNARGVIISAVEPGGPAALGGLRNARNPREVDGIRVYTSVDIITAIDGSTITGMPSLIAYLSSQTRPGDTVTLTVVRDGSQAIQLPVTLVARPES
ncbi:MAG: trypsin-like peptidase domain-containing protein [Anaerolineae bacterium]|nr:trypsin-like peptidase domain-containing protein [Anaerolineae bacterium]NUQ05337.1 trypsin-like peptidase domain-containing protein [Anaerolineae bacterium]